MADDELAIFDSLLRGAKKVLEYGCGGSTALAALHKHLHVFGVESDPAWLRKVEAHPDIISASASGRFLLNYVSIGPTKKWGKPLNEDFRHNWPLYSRIPWSNQSDYDFIFVDGRFRVACVLHAVLNAPTDALIVVHDFWDRSDYHVVLPFLDWKQSCRTLGVFQRRREIDRDYVTTLIEKYQYVSA
jgi:protein O-GlcNAc transferase